MACYWRMGNEGEDRKQPLASASERTGVTIRKAYKPICNICFPSVNPDTAHLQPLRNTQARVGSMLAAPRGYDGANVGADSALTEDISRTRGQR